MGTKAVGRGATHLSDREHITNLARLILPTIFFYYVRIPADYLLGEEDQGFSQVMHGFDRYWSQVQ